MALSVIGAGLGRTGTFSIKLALEQLGLGPCHHMDDVFASAERLQVWEAVTGSDEIDWDAVFAGYQSTIDWPSTNYWRELADAYPDARVLLSVRPREDWWNSFSRTIRTLIESRSQATDEHIRAVLTYADRIIGQETFDGLMHDKVHALQVFDRRIADVEAAISADRLLIFDVARGWEPLCDFFDLPVPSGDFPRTNDAPEFWQHFGAAMPPTDGRS